MPSSAPMEVVKKVEDLDAPGSLVDPHKTREIGFWIVKGGIKQWRWGDENGNWSDNDESPACVSWKTAHDVLATKWDLAVWEMDQAAKKDEEASCSKWDSLPKSWDTPEPRGWNDPPRNWEAPLRIGRSFGRSNRRNAR